ncbi:MAG: HmuY family protein [Bacteroidales bacterium]|nr:HmuY family protein [Bacteroidales bacterium]
MKRTSLLLITVLFSAVYLFTACEEEDNIIPATVGTITVDASDYSSWVYFSFKDDTVVTVTDFENSTDWDIGFHRSDLRLNCGMSGTGLGGSYATGITNFDEVITAPETGYSLNDMIEIATDISTFPPGMETVPGDTILANWISFEIGASGPEYTYSNEIFIIKTADGKYAKIWLKDYFNDEAQGGHITMKYLYQTEGNTKLD